MLRPGEGTDHAGQPGDEAVTDGAGSTAVGSEEWGCPHDAHPDADRCVFHLSRDERERLGVTPEDVRDRLLSVAEADDPELRRVLGATLPALDLDYHAFGGETAHPLDLRDCEIEALSVVHATVTVSLDLSGATVDRLVLDHAEVDGAVDLDDATVDTLRAFETHFDGDVTCERATVGELHLEEATFEDDTSFDDTTVERTATFDRGTFRGRSNRRDDNASFCRTDFQSTASFVGTTFEYVAFTDANFTEARFEDSRFEGDADFSGGRFGGADFDEARFRMDATFETATFDGETHFRGVEFEGGANMLAQDVTFADAEFRGPVTFERGRMWSSDFTATTFEDEAVFQAVSFEDDADFSDATFAAFTDFDEARFRMDGHFRRVTIEGEADFRGVEFEGGANVLADDADFESATFEGPADFDDARFAQANFREVTFGEAVVFQGTVFDDDVTLVGGLFEGPADFDEVHFLGDIDLEGATFEGRAKFRGVECVGESRHLEESARFRNVAFRSGAVFTDGVFYSADFTGVEAADTLEFRDVDVQEHVNYRVESTEGTTTVDLTGATLTDGSIVQPADHWVRYDCTRATIGEVSLSIAGERDSRKLFEYFRFIESEFDGFDFSRHRAYLDRNDWRLHTFDDGGVDYTPAVGATPEAIETTYLNAYNNAVATGDGDAAIEFSIHQSRHRRRKYLGYVRDDSLPTRYRLRKVGDAVGNVLWYASCGYGYRLGRIIGVSTLVILLWGLVYASPFADTTATESLSSVGQLATAEGVSIVANNVYYSLITFTTVGYGDINPLGAVTRTMAAAEGVLGVLLSALVVFVLGRRVAV